MAGERAGRRRNPAGYRTRSVLGKKTPQTRAPVRDSVSNIPPRQRAAGRRRRPPAAARPPRRYLSSTVAPTSSSCDLTWSASSWLTPSLTGFGAESTRSFASLRPRPVTARTTLITWIFCAPAFVRTTSNDVFSSAAAPPSAAAGAPAAATATGAAAVMPHSSSILFFSSTSSSTVMLPSCSNTVSTAAIGLVLLRCVGGFVLKLLDACIDQPIEVLERCVDQARDRVEGRDHRADHLAAEHLDRREFRERVDVGAGDDPALHDAAPDLEHPRVAGGVRQRLRDGDGIAVRLHERDRRRPLEEREQRVRPGGLGRAAREGVLDDAEPRPALDQLAPQGVDLGHRQAAVVRDDHRLRPAELLRQVRDDPFLVRFLHLPPRLGFCRSIGGRQLSSVTGLPARPWPRQPPGTL